ncbi:MAG: molybdenum cofactor biosynthesis protein B [Candidatus Nanopelagicales bacterium]
MTHEHFGAPAELADPMRAAVVVVSTRVAAGEAADLTGGKLVEALRSWGFDCGEPTVVPDVAASGQRSLGVALRTLVRAGSSVVITTGGTGLTRDDVTPEVTAGLGGRVVPGIAEALRSAGVARGVPTAALSRGMACVVDDTLIVNLAGSRGAVDDGIAVLSDIVPHAVRQISRPVSAVFET